MRTLFLCAAVLALAGCTAKNAPPVSEAKTAAPAAQPSNTVTLAAAAQRASGVAVDAVTERSLPETIRASARLTHDENLTWRVGAVTDGRVIQVLAAPGDSVQAGQPLARIHGHDIHDSRALYRNAKTELMRAEANVQFAEKARDRAKRLYDMKAGSLEQLERAETELKNSQAALATAKTEVERNRQHLVEFLGVSEEGGHDHQPGADSDEADLIPVRSPASGTVVTRNITPGTVVTPATDLFLLSNLSSLWAIAEVNEEYLSKLRVGMPARIFVQAWPDQAFPGRIGKLGEALDPATRTLKVRIDVPNPSGKLKPEMYATSEIDVGSSRAGVFVPEEALQEVRGQIVVFVQTGPETFEARPVETGQALGGSREIRRGLRSGDRVATRGAFILKSEYLKATLSGE
jgi:membrane fusion protein, heavy metal efflux system